MQCFWCSSAQVGNTANATASRQCSKLAFVSVTSAGLAALSNVDRESPVSKFLASSNLVVPTVKFKPLMTLLRFLSKINHSSHVPVVKHGTVSSYVGELPSVGEVRSLCL